MKRREYVQPIIFMMEGNVELLNDSDVVFPRGASGDVEVIIGSGTVDPEDALARPNYSVWDE